MTAMTEARIRAWIKCAAGSVTSSLNDELLHIVDAAIDEAEDAAIEEAEAAAAARQREADAAACRAVLEFWDRDSPAPGPYEAGAVAAAEMCVERVMGGGPAAGGGGAGGAT